MSSNSGEPITGRVVSAREAIAALESEASERELTAAEIAELRPFAQIIYGMRQVAVVDEDAAFEIAATVLDEIALADSVEAVFAANEKGPKDAEDFLEQSLGVFNVKFWRSAEKFRKGTLGYYVVMDYVDFNGETDMISVGATNVVGSMFKFMLLGAITGDKQNPFWVKIHGRDTPNGTLYTVMAGDPPPF
jgi:hypothetical protein